MLVFCQYVEFKMLYKSLPCLHLPRFKQVFWRPHYALLTEIHFKSSCSFRLAVILITALYTTMHVFTDNSESQRKNSFVGTAQYVSPEVLTSKHASKR